MNKCIMVTLLFVTCLISFSKEEKNSRELNESGVMSELTKALQDLGLNERNEVTREEFKTLFMRLMTKGENVDEEHKEFVQTLATKYVEKIPETIKLNKIDHYLDLNNLNVVLTEMINGIELD